MKLIRAGWLVSIVAIAGTAIADPIAVDFGGLPTTLDITGISNTLTLNGVSMYFDAQGDPTGFAAADSIGLYGTTAGALVFDFSAPATALDFNFSVLGVSGPDPNALVSLFYSGGTSTDVVVVAGVFTPYDPSAPTLGQIDGTLNYNGPAFDQVVTYFSYDPNALFTADHISYATATVPEPGSVSLFVVGAGLMFLASHRRRKLAA